MHGCDFTVCARDEHSPPAMKIRPTCEISGDASLWTGADARVPNVPEHTLWGTHGTQSVIVCVWTMEEGAAGAP